VTRPPRSIRLACAAAAACLLGIAPVAQAGVPHTPFKVAPASAGTSSVITASWKVDRRLKRGERFGFEISVVTPPGNTAASFSGYNCAGSADSPPRVVKKGSVLRATFRPGAGRFGLERWHTWCPGTARILLFRYPEGTNTNVSRFLGLRTVPITLAPGETVPFTSTAVKVTLMPGSTLTAGATGRPDRSTPVTGVLRGVVDGPFQPNSDIRVISLAGALTPASFAPDPLCPGTTPPATFDAVPASSAMLLKANGDTTWNLTLNGAPSQLFGCGPAGPLSGTTALALAGHVGPKGLLELQQTASVTGIALPGGSQGGLAASLVLNVDLSGQG